MTSDTARQLARSKRAYLIAPAGCGKTQEIAKAVDYSDRACQLILTHTHAGVHSLRLRIKRLGVSPKKYAVDTIAGWALCLASAYPALSGLDISIPPTGEEWLQVYKACRETLGYSTIKRVTRASYSGVYVDEYQDCTLTQHGLIMALAEVLPCRILGDPLQGIFGFGSDPLVDWERDIAPNFDRLDDLKEPWRWKGPDRNEKLGEWLTAARRVLCEGGQIDLQQAPVIWQPRTPDNPPKVCMRLAREHTGASIVAIRKWASECHRLAKCLRGMYTSMEELAAEDLMTHADEIEQSSGTERAIAVIDFAKKCKTKIFGKRDSVRAKFTQGEMPNPRNFKKHPEVVEALVDVAGTEELFPVLIALGRIEQIEGVLYRRELWDEMKRALLTYQSGKFETLRDAAWNVRNQTRVLGRRVDRPTVSRTLLIKGLEFDHAIILDADQFNKENLYVAMTRASKSLTVLLDDPVITPTECA